MSTRRDDVRDRVEAGVGHWRADLVHLSRALHEAPETSFEEHRSAGMVGDLLDRAGFEVHTGAYDLPTSLQAAYGRGDVTVCFCAEYDALPEIGHACGHNLIAALGVGAAVALASVADELAIRVKVLGTPAEEEGGGKVLMLDPHSMTSPSRSLDTRGRASTSQTSR